MTAGTLPMPLYQVVLVLAPLLVLVLLLAVGTGLLLGRREGQLPEWFDVAIDDLRNLWAILRAPTRAKDAVEGRDLENRRESKR